MSLIAQEQIKNIFEKVVRFKIMRIGYDREESIDYGKKIGAVILAGGLSSRMKEFKPLLHVDGMPAVEGLIESAKVAGIDDIIVVTGHNRELLDPILRKHGVREAYNPDYKDGMFSSINAGLREAMKDIGESLAAKAGYLIMPVDCPLISARVIRTLMAGVLAKKEEAIEEDRENNFAVVTFDGKKGHPLYIPVSKAQEIMDHEGEGGLNTITDKYIEEMLRVPVDEEGCILDMDTMEDYQDIRNFVEKGFAREKLELLTARKRIFLVRHGETLQHEEPMFIGQYDVELSEDGRIQAEILGREIAQAMREDVEAEALGMDKFGREPMPAIERIYSSDLKRARQTAEIIREHVNKMLPNPVEIEFHEGLRELNLGGWDGKPIREVKEKYSEEFERRGRDIFTFKLRNGMENFYDMQYRVVNTLREILRNDDAKDIIIVAHSGVIRALENNINGLKVENDWEPIKKGQFRMLEPFPVQPNERDRQEDKPMSSDSLTMESLLEYYE